MTPHRTITILVIISLLTLSLFACSGPAAGEDPDSTYQGTITISGAWALYPLVIRWSEEFHALHPGVRFDISAGGAGKGMADTLANAVDIGMVSRKIYPQEIDQGAIEFAVAKDAVFLTMNKLNPAWEHLRASGITREALIDIYLTGAISNWQDLTGDPETSSSIHVYTRSDACGAAETWAEFLGKHQEDLLGIGVFGDPGVLESVSNDQLGLGYNNLNYAYDQKTGLPIEGVLVVPLDVNNNGKVDPEEVIDQKDQALEAVRAGIYPSPPARELYLVTNGLPQNLVLEFIRWVLTDGQAFVEGSGYIPVSQEKLKIEMLKIEQ